MANSLIKKLYKEGKKTRTKPRFEVQVQAVCKSDGLWKGNRILLYLEVDSFPQKTKLPVECKTPKQLNPDWRDLLDQIAEGQTVHLLIEASRSTKNVPLDVKCTGVKAGRWILEMA